MIGVKEVVYKTRREAAEFCTVCNQFLSGNGSVITPWRCGCGQYAWDWSERRYIHPKEERQS